MSIDMLSMYLFFFFFNDTATTEIYTLSLHDALPIYLLPRSNHDSTPGSSALNPLRLRRTTCGSDKSDRLQGAAAGRRSEEHTSELQSLAYLVCRLLLEKKNIDTEVLSQ